MPTRRRVLFLLAAVAVFIGALALAGCGGSGSGSDRGSGSGGTDARASVVARCLHDAGRSQVFPNSWLAMLRIGVESPRES